jgi:general secretion pathway protein A
MYETYYGFSERPFDLSPNPKYLVLTPAHEEALSNIEYGIASQKGITLLLGVAGTGKTTLLRKALANRLRTRHAPGQGCLYFNNPALSREEFFQALAAGYGLSPACAGSKTTFLREFEEFVSERHRRGLPSTLVVDEAQALPDALLEELRLLVNIESDTDKFLSLVLAGQPELGERLNLPHLHQFKQRVALRCRLLPLSLHETAGYISARIRLAGGDPKRVFTREAVITVHTASGGIPRIINVVCDNALLAGYAADQQPVDADTIHEVCADFDLDSAGDRRPPNVLSRPREWVVPRPRTASG